MCEHAHDDPADRLSRRGFLVAGGAAFAAVTGMLAPGQARAAGPAAVGQVVTKNASHLHSTGSELRASMSAQLRQAANWAVDRVWWTEHGWQAVMLGYRELISFDGQPDVERGARLWFHPEPPTGPTADSGGRVVSTGPSPLDSKGGALEVWATGSTSQPATQRVLLSNAPELEGERLRAPYRGWIGRTTFTVEVTPVQLPAGSWLELAVDLSDHPGPDGRLQTYSLVYRLSSSAPPSRVAHGAAGVVTVPVAAGPRATLHLDPVADIAALWPQLQAQDMSLFDLHFGATSVDRGHVVGRWESFRFHWVTPDRSLEIQRELMAAYAGTFHGVVQEAGTEISWIPGAGHVCRLGGDPRIQDAVKGDVGDDYFPRAVAAIHSSGGVAVKNHPFGAQAAVIPPPAAQAQHRREVFAELYRTRLYGVDGLEVAYANRGGADLRAHLDLYDTLLRNLLLPTAIGASDDHSANDWGRVKNGFMTVSLSHDDSTASVLAALAGGRAHFAHIGLAPHTVLDLELGNGTRMGQVTVGHGRSQTVRVTARGLPAGSAVRVVQGAVDYAGTGEPDPATHVLATRPASDFAGGPVAVPFRVTGPGGYVRTEVVARDGRTVVAGSSPVVALTQAPPAGVELPAGRVV